MGDELSGTEAGKPKRRQAVKQAARPAASRFKATVTLSAEAYQRLSIHATMANQTHSEPVERLINDNLRRWVVSDRGGSEGSTADAA